jgi:hypothetical protein
MKLELRGKNKTEEEVEISLSSKIINNLIVITKNSARLENFDPKN